jgi:hypothetical protein
MRPGHEGSFGQTGGLDHEKEPNPKNPMASDRPDKNTQIIKHRKSLPLWGRLACSEAAKPLAHSLNVGPAKRVAVGGRDRCVVAKSLR